MNEYGGKVAKSDYSIKGLRDKFLATGRAQVDTKWRQNLSVQKTYFLNKYPEHASVINDIFDKMEAKNTEDGLEFIFKMAETKPSGSDLGKSWKEWLWDMKTPPARPDKNSSTLLQRWETTPIYQFFVNKLLRGFFKGSTMSPNQYRIYLARLGYTKKAAAWLEFKRLIYQRVLIPISFGSLYYLLFNGGVSRTGEQMDMEASNEGEISLFRETVIDPIVFANTDIIDIFTLGGADKEWVDFLKGLGFATVPGEWEKYVYAYLQSGKATYGEKGEWKFKNKDTNEIVLDKNGNEVLFKTLGEAADFYAKSKADKKNYVCLANTKKSINDCARLKKELIRRRTQSEQDELKKIKEKVNEYYEKKKGSDKRFLMAASNELLVNSKSENKKILQPNYPMLFPYFVFETGGTVTFPYTINVSDNDQLKMVRENGKWFGYKGNAKYNDLADFSDALVDDINNKKLMNIFKTDDPNEEKPEEKVKKDVTPKPQIQTDSILAITNKLIKEMKEGKKFGEDNFKHWKDTFKFKKYDEKTNQLKDVKISSKMDEIMDRIDHFRKKYDEDDAFVRAVVDVYGTQIDIIQHTKGLAHLTENIVVSGLMSVLATLRESKELVTWTVKHYKDGNWELVKGNFNKKELLNVGKTKKEREERQKDSENPAEGLKKKEQESIMILSRDEKEGLNGLPTKVKQKIKEKLRQGWTTEKPFEFLNTYYNESEINSVFNDKIKIYKLKPSAEFFRTLAKNSSKITMKKGFCKSVKNAKGDYDLNEKEKNSLNHFITKCQSKFGV